MSCNFCHESMPPNRNDGFCSDICLIHYLKGVIERLREEECKRYNNIAELMREIERLRTDLRESNQLAADNFARAKRAEVGRDELDKALDQTCRQRNELLDRLAAIAKGEK